MMYKVNYSGHFKKAYKLCRRRGLPINELDNVITLLAHDGKLPPEYRPHLLSGRYAGTWECHVGSDWLLLWQQNDTELTLLMIDTGTHSDVF